MFDFIYGQKFQELDGLKTQSGYSIVYSHTHEADTLVKDIIKDKNNQYVIITHNSDGRIEHPKNRWDSIDPYDYNLDNVVLWFGQNLNCQHPKCKVLPIGLENPHILPEQKKSEQIQSLIDNPPTKQYPCYINHNIDTNPSDRKPIYSIFGHQAWCLTERGRNGSGFDGYINNLAQSYFTFAPSGNGYQTHRLFESLYVDCIPIVKNELYNHFLSKYFNVVLVNNWQHFNIKHLTHLISNPTSIDKQKLTFQYWKDKILNT